MSLTTSTHRIFGTAGALQIFCVPGDIHRAAEELAHRGIIAGGPWNACIEGNKLLFRPGTIPAIAWTVDARDRARLDGAGLLDPTRRVGG